MVKLICALVGAAESPFPVDIEANQLVGDFKEAIKSDNSNSTQCDAGELQLYSTKKNGAFLAYQNADLAELSKSNCSQKVKDRYFIQENEMIS